MSLGRHFVAVSDGLNARLAMVRKVRTSGGAIFYYMLTSALSIFLIAGFALPALHHHTLTPPKTKKKN